MRNLIPASVTVGMTLWTASAGLAGCGASEDGGSVGSQMDDLRNRPGDGRNRACGARLGDTCRKGEFCDWTLEGMCGFADATGICTPIPQGCTFQYDPVCGCDGYTYGNACAANGVGVSVLHPGPCEDEAEEDAGVAPESDAGCGAAPRECGGLAGLPCDEGEFCDFEGDPSGVACGAADGVGICQPIPEACTLEYDPVCGCDDQTYGNACAAHAAGVSVAARGECAPGAVSCDPRAIRCRRLPPECPFGQVPAVEGTCYGDCVPVEQCACREAAACPQPEAYTCHLSAGHCGPYVN